MNIEEIKAKTKPGDIDTAAKIVCITPANGYKALKREGSKHYDSMVKALETIIANREQMIEQGI